MPMICGDQEGQSIQWSSVFGFPGGPGEDALVSGLCRQVLQGEFIVAVCALHWPINDGVVVQKPLMEKHADSLVQGMYRMIVSIPSNVTNMRKEYFIAARHILGTQEIKPR